MTKLYGSKRLKIAVIGGGTGSFTLLSALKNHTDKISALVNMADDGGSTGKLRDELGVLPPGDVRQCLVALSNTPDMRDLFNYRFDEGSLEGHAFGNLFLTALEKMTGDFAKGLKLASSVLNITGVVEPITLTNVKLAMRDQDGKKTLGEFEIAHCKFGDDRPEFWLEPEAKANPRAVAAIEDADIVVIAPGNLYGSLAPALIVPGIGEALAKTKAITIYVCNLVTKPGQTDGYMVDDFADEIERLTGGSFLDAVLFNTEKPSDELLAKYAADGELAVEYDLDKLREAPYIAVGANLLSGKIWQNTNKSDPIASRRTFIRHDPKAVADGIKVCMNMPPQLEVEAVGDKAERHRVKTVDAFCVLDLDRTLLDTEKAFSVFVDAVHEVGYIDGYEVHDAVLESGGSFDVLAYVRKELNDRLGSTSIENIESIVADIKTEFVERAKHQDLLLPGASELLSELDDNNMPYGILTFGGDEWQGWKLEAAQLTAVPTIVTKRKDKAVMMRDSWRRKILGGFQLPDAYNVDDCSIIAKKLLFLDDKLESLDGAPDDVLAIHVIDDTKDVKRVDYRGKNITVARGLAKAATILTTAGYLSSNRH